jgi:hypothetical protein
MKKGGGKQKGSQWERDFCKSLSLWYTFDKDKDVFWRTHSSGARHGISEESGDVMTVKPIGDPLMSKLIIELKCVNDTDLILDMIRSGKVSKMWDWWLKVSHEAKAWKKAPLLVVKLSRRTIICMSRIEDDLLEDKYEMHDRIRIGDAVVCTWSNFLIDTRLKRLRVEV